MAGLPISLKRFSGQWVIATVLKVAGEFFVIAATFTPMKAILILASDDVPEFFPQPLVEGGPTLASTALIATAIVASVLNTLVKRTIQMLDGLAINPKELGRLRRKHYFLWEALAERNMFSGATVVFLSGLVMVLISPLFFVLSMLWIVLVSAAVSVSLKEKLIGPYTSRREQLLHEIGKSLSSTSLWSMVGVALVVLLVMTPTLGTTGILLAVIVGRKLLVGVKTIIPFLVIPSVFGDKQAEKAGKQPPRTLFSPSVANRKPSEFISSAYGQEVVRGYFDQCGALPGFRVLRNAPNGPLSICANLPNQSQALVRLFPLGEALLRDMELAQRRNHGDETIFAGSSSRPISLAAFPGIHLTLDSDAECVDFDSSVTLEEAATFQLGIENRDHASSQMELGQPPLQLQGLSKQLEIARGITGSSEKAIDAILTLLPQALVHVERLPDTLVPTRPLQPSDFYRARNGSIVFLGDVAFTPGKSGESWGDVDYYVAALENMDSESGVRGGDPARSALYAELCSVSDSLSRLEFGSLEEHHRKLGALLERFV
jgi:hypothetical protein